MMIKNLVKQLFTLKTFYKAFICFFIVLAVRFGFKFYDIALITESDFLFTMYSSITLLMISFTTKLCDFFDLPNPFNYIPVNKQYHSIGPDGISDDKNQNK